MIRKERSFSREEFGRRASANLLGTPAWIASPEDTIVAKLEWAVASGSDRQLRDVAAMLDIGWESLDFAYFDRWIVASDSMRPGVGRRRFALPIDRAERGCRFNPDRLRAEEVRDA